MGNRAQKPGGFGLWDCWPGDYQTDVNKWAARDLFEQCFDGGRYMVKLHEYESMDDPMPEIIGERIAYARSQGKKVILCVDWHNTATSNKDYHKSIWLPGQDRYLQDLIESMLEDYAPDILEVANEPWYRKRGATDRITHKRYAELVEVYARAIIGRGKPTYLLASGTNRDRWDWDRWFKVANGWEWSDLIDTLPGKWPMAYEGAHAAVTHRYTTAEEVIDAISWSWFKGKAVGWQFPVFEGECAPCGKTWNPHSQMGADVYEKVVGWARGKQLPLCLLNIGAGEEGFPWPPKPGGWGMLAQLASSDNLLSESAKRIFMLRGKTPIEGPSEPPVEPPTKGRNYIKDTAALMKTLDKKSQRAVYRVAREFDRLTSG